MMKHIKIKIRNKYYNGTIVNKISDSVYRCEYIIGNKKTTGFFKESDFKIIEEQKIENNELVKRKHYKIKCPCGYHCTVPKFKTGFGKCPECMKENWEILEDRGIY